MKRLWKKNKSRLLNEVTNTTTRKNERTLGNLITIIDYPKVSHPRPSEKHIFFFEFLFLIKSLPKFLKEWLKLTPVQRKRGRKQSQCRRCS